ncbi:MAG: carboxypeptidase-like regulatory domain-containing protein [Desulfobacteraceae bacterium]|jgi:hypothetical protein|nr:carboxypeptidase-like regulatory domain-containing protein [Desulfobacteraceae bacterium]
MKKTFFLNRYMVTFGSIAIVTALWNLYIAFNNDGIIAGRVVGPDNRAVVGATVTLFQKTLYVAEPRDKTTTDKNGAFLLTGHASYKLWLEAEKNGLGKSSKEEYRLYFRNQNLRLSEPLRIEATK